MEQMEMEQKKMEQKNMEQKNMEQKPGRKKFRYNLLFVLFMATVLMLIGSFIGAIVNVLVILGFQIDADHRWILNSYLVFIGITAVVLLYTICTDKKIFKDYFRGSIRSNTAKIGLGLLTGFIMNSLCILIAFIKGDIRFCTGTISFAWVVVAFLVVFIQSGTEELLTRGYLYMHIRERYGWKIGIAVCSIYFSAIHIFNGGVTILALLNIAVIGLFYAVSVKCFGNIWFAAANHAAWNFTQNFIFGLPNSGIVSNTSIFALKTAEESVFYDPTFGVEGTITATIVIIVSILVLVLIEKKKLGKETERKEINKER